MEESRTFLLWNPVIEMCLNIHMYVHQVHNPWHPRSARYVSHPI